MPVATLNVCLDRKETTSAKVSVSGVSGSLRDLGVPIASRVQ